MKEPSSTSLTFRTLERSLDAAVAFDYGHGGWENDLLASLSRHLGPHVGSPHLAPGLRLLPSAMRKLSAQAWAAIFGGLVVTIMLAQWLRTPTPGVVALGQVTAYAVPPIDVQSVFPAVSGTSLGAHWRLQDAVRQLQQERVYWTFEVHNHGTRTATATQFTVPFAKIAVVTRPGKADQIQNADETATELGPVVLGDLQPGDALSVRVWSSVMAHDNPTLAYSDGFGAVEVERPASATAQFFGRHWPLVAIVVSWVGLLATAKISEQRKTILRLKAALTP